VTPWHHTGGPAPLTGQPDLPLLCFQGPSLPPWDWRLPTPLTSSRKPSQDSPAKKVSCLPSALHPILGQWFSNQLHEIHTAGYAQFLSQEAQAGPKDSRFNTLAGNAGAADSGVTVGDTTGRFEAHLLPVILPPANRGQTRGHRMSQTTGTQLHLKLCSQVSECKSAMKEKQKIRRDK
jgi:hypothetical protein